MDVIKTVGLSKSFKTDDGVVNAVKSVDLQVEEGIIFGFLGPNGAGKTTTLRMLSTLIKPGSGQASIAGYDLLKESKKVRQNIGYVGQVGGLEGTATGRENLILQGQLYGLSKKEAKIRTDELIKAFNMESFCDRKSNTYSGGQKRRVDLAIGIMHKPKLVFLDEPTTGLDPQTRARLWDELRKLKKEGTTIFLTTHYLDEADALCDKIAIIDYGSIVSKGTPNELKKEISGDIITIGFDNPAENDRAKELLSSQKWVREIDFYNEFIRVFVHSGEEVLPLLLDLMIKKNFVIRTLELTRPSLDDVFLKKTGRALRDDGAENKTAENKTTDKN